MEHYAHNLMLAPMTTVDTKRWYASANTRAMRAVQDRDLLAEAANVEACTGAATSLLARCYPSVGVVGGFIDTRQN